MKLIVRLKSCLGDCKYLDSCTCILKSPYEIIEKTTFYIIDDNPVRLVYNDDVYHLTVNNHSNQEICLVKTDKCLFIQEIKKCDCILFSLTKIFFIEISNSSPASRSRKRKDAVDQLSSTIDKFIENNIDLSAYSSKAVICFVSGQTYPTQASSNTKRAMFLDKYKVYLEEGNEIIF